MKITAVLALLLCAVLQPLIAATPQGTAFIYQGELVDNGQPVTGTYDVRVELYDAPSGGVFIDQVVFQGPTAVSVSQGFFTLQIDVGDAPFSGDAVWLELALAPSGQTPLTVLTPRQSVSNAPYAIQSAFVAANGVDSLALQSLSVTSPKIATGAVGSREIQDFSINNIDIMPSTITQVQLANDSVGSLEIVAGAVGASEINSAEVQRRVNGMCSAGAAMRAINPDGSVLCEFTGGNAWGLNGNTGTNPNSHFLGTTDAQPLIVKVNSITAARVEPTSAIGGSEVNWIGGSANNQIVGSARGGFIGGGTTNLIQDSFSTVAGGQNNQVLSTTGAQFATIAGGVNNRVLASNGTVGGGISNVAGMESSTVSGGSSNNASGELANISGGSLNTASGLASSVPGGLFNVAGGDYSLAAGRNARVRTPAQAGNGNGDLGTFVWASNGTEFTSTGSYQFLVDANGGIGLGTNAPQAAVHIHGIPGAVGSTPGGAETVLRVEARDVTDNSALVVNRWSGGVDAALILANNAQPEFDLRAAGNALHINHYDASNALQKRTMMRVVSDGATQRMDFNADVEPEANGAFNLGSASFRWDTVYAVNPLNVSSDERLKTNIRDLQAGLPEVLALRPVSYAWKNSAHSGTHLGLIAQEVEQILPAVVEQANDARGTRSMRYGELIPVLINAMQQQQALIDAQRDSLEALTQRLEALESAQARGLK